MAAKFKSQIITDINREIVTNGNITAIDTNAILKDILDCIELNSTPSNTSTFRYQSTAPLEDRRGATLSYSLRGIVDSFVNITFRIEILETNVNNLIFEHNDAEMFQSLQGIIENRENYSDIDFLVKIENDSVSSQNRGFRVGSLNFNCDERFFNIIIQSQELDDNLFNGDHIFTSFAIHCPNEF